MVRYFLLLVFYLGTLSSLTPDEIDCLAEETLKKWDIPGLSLAIIHQGKEIHVKGYGVRERGTDKFVNAQTLFQINSLTKAFTALTVDMLVEEQKLDLDLPIRTYFPNFQSKDPLVTEQLSLRDLLCHRSGFPGNLYGGWRLHYNTHRTCRELMQRLAFVDLVFPFRTRFNYDNIGYAIAGEAVCTATGLFWADFCHQKIFQPLHMTRSCISYSAFLSDDNSASPHLYQALKPSEGHNWEKDGLEAASGIHSSAQDMALWLDYCLSHPEYFSEAQMPHIVVNVEDLSVETEFPTFAIISHGQSQLHYGRGWWIYYLDDKKVCRHTGSSSGMQSVLAIVPEEQLGIVILSNQSWTPAVSALMNQLLDGFLGRSKIDWHQLGLEAYSKVKENEKKRLVEIQCTRHPEIKPSLPLSSYAGTYTHSGYGSILIKNASEGLTFELLFCKEKGDLNHWGGDQFEMDHARGGREPFLCEFLISPDAEVIGLQIEDMGIFERTDKL